MHPALRKGPLFLLKTPPFSNFYKKTPPISFPVYKPVCRQAATVAVATNRIAARATRCLARIVLYTGVNARFDKLAKVVGQTLTVASII